MPSPVANSRRNRPHDGIENIVQCRAGILEQVLDLVKTVEFLGALTQGVERFGDGFALVRHLARFSGVL